MLQVFDKVALVLASILSLEVAIAFHLVVVPHAIVPLNVRPVFGTLALKFVAIKVSRVRTLVSLVEVFTFAMTAPFEEVALV